MDTLKSIKIAEFLLKSSGLNVFAPPTLVNKWAKDELSNSGQEAWCDVQLALSQVSEKELRFLVKLIVHRYCRLIDIRKLFLEVMDEGKEVAEYISNHPEYRNADVDMKNELNILLNSLEE